MLFATCTITSLFHGAGTTKSTAACHTGHVFGTTRSVLGCCALQTRSMTFTIHFQTCRAGSGFRSTTGAVLCTAAMVFCGRITLFTASITSTCCSTTRGAGNGMTALTDAVADCAKFGVTDLVAFFETSRSDTSASRRCDN